MQEQIIPFLLSGAFEANPHLYDYLHRLSFSPSGLVEMVDGAGQVLNSLVNGRFSLQAAGQNAALVQFFWNIRDEQEWPCLLYQCRYVFEGDPLTRVFSSRTGNLYYRLEGEEPDTNAYYRQDDRQQLTARELSQMGISLP